jgi:hypothetical protein
MRPRTDYGVRAIGPAEGVGQPSILAMLRAWSAKHPLRPADGSPPSLCDPAEIPIVWAHDPDRDIPFSPKRVPRDLTVEESIAEAFVAAVERLQTAGAADASVEAGWAPLYVAALDCRPATLRLIHARLVERRAPVRVVRLAARWLLERATHGEAIELAIPLLIMSKDPGAADDLAYLGRHPWLWERVTRALDVLRLDATDLWWARAFNAFCCSRREVLRMMAPRLGDRPDIRDWILRHGLTSWPGDPFLQAAFPKSNDDTDPALTSCVAAACAVAGDLTGALAAPDIDEGLLDAACSIISRTFGEMREDDLETCPDGVVAIDKLVGHLLDRCDSLPRLGIVYDLLCWIGRSNLVPASVARSHFPNRWDEDAEAQTWGRLASLGWTEEVRDYLTDDCLRILRRSHWPGLIRETFAHYDTASHRERWVAWRVAPIVGVDLVDEAIGWLERLPLDSTLCSWLLDTDDVARVERVVRLAERVLPRALRDAAAASPNAVRRFQRGGALEYVIRAIVRHSVYSERLVALAISRRGIWRDIALRAFGAAPAGPVG